jgi:hypothetical protein
MCLGGILPRRYPSSPRRLQVFFYSVALALTLGSSFGRCVAQERNVLCRDGNGAFQAEFHTGVRVQVGAVRTGELATRTCEASLAWSNRSLVVATNAPEVDVDTFGVDLGFGVPVTTFQVKKAANDCCLEYQIYSLEKPPRLLRTITGGDFFSAADRDLDGRLEIWTDDTAAMKDFENLTPGELDWGPTVVLRFLHGGWLDAGSEFQPYFDREIERIRKEIDPDSLRGFRNTDGKLSADISLSAEQMHRLRAVKAKILEVVWAYLYSGREQQAWRELAAMWPAADVPRIQSAILNARAQGITAQVGGVPHERDGRRRRVPIFDAVNETRSAKPEVTPPVPILLRRPPLDTTNTDLPQSEALLELVIDASGKVRSAKAAGKAPAADTDLIRAADGWKFIPAFRDGRAVASRMRLAVSLRR